MDHDHCLRCVRSSCKEHPTCSVEDCRNGCGVSLHCCKWEEHDRHTCPEALVNCTNATYGCRLLLSRKNLGNHIQHCPASIVSCGFSHSRSHNAPKCGTMPQEQPKQIYIDDKILEGDKNIMEKFSSDGGPLPSLDLSMLNFGFTYAGRKPKKPQGYACSTQHGRYYTQNNFVCNEMVRRDEFPSHWKQLHVDIQTNMNMVIQRCPLQQYGCTYGRQNIVPTPLGSSLDYNVSEDCLLVQPPSIAIAISEGSHDSSQYTAQIQKKKELALYGYGEEGESYDVLGQLPIEVLYNILKYMDSLSLRSLSLVNAYLRDVCFDVLEKQGIVYFKWTKDSNFVSSSGFRWISSPKVS